MDCWLRQSTAVTVPIGPFVDSTDGDTEETALTIAQADVRLTKNGAASAQKNNATSASHDADGVYLCPLSTTDTNTLGQLVLWVHVAGALFAKHTFHVVPANIWDSFFSTDLLDVSVVQFNGTAGTFASGRPEVNATHWGGTAVASAFVRATIEQFIGTSITEGAAGRIATAFQTYFNVASPVATAASINQTGDSFARIGATGSGLTSLASQASLDTLDDLVDTEIGTIISRLGTPSDLGSGATVAANLADIEAQTDDIGAAGAGLTSIPNPAGVTTLLSRVGTPTDLGTGASLSANLVDIENQTEDIPAAATVASAVRTNLATELAFLDASVNSRLATAGYTAPLSAAGTRTALGMTTDNLDTQLTAIADDANRIPADPADASDVAAAIAALNNISTSDVLTQVNAALNTAISELGVGAPAATPTLRTAVMLLYMALRNRTTTTATEQTIQNDAGTVITTMALSDDATTMTKAEAA